MNVYDCIRDYLMNTAEPKLLDGSLAQFYKASKDQNCYKELVRRVDQWCEEENEDKESTTAIGSALYDCYLQTKDEKYRNAMKKLHAEYNEFWQVHECPDSHRLEVLYTEGPFHMAYDTAFENKEHYNEIVETFEDTYSSLTLGGEISLPFATTYAMALIDTMDVMSKEIFEHYKTLEGLLKITIQGILRTIKNENNIYQEIDKSNIDRFTLLDLAKISYIILKACRMKVLLSEKYQATGMDLFDYILGVVYDIKEEKLKLAATKDEVMAVLIMAYSQKLMLDSEI